MQSELKRSLSGNCVLRESLIISEPRWSALDEWSMFLILAERKKHNFLIYSKKKYVRLAY